MTDELEEMKQELKAQEDELQELNQHPDLQKLQKLEHRDLRKTRELRTNLKFKKALKKLEKAMERNNVTMRDLSTRDLKKYMKSTVTGILNEGPKVHDLKQVLIKTRLVLEDEDHPLNIKSDLREKILENIHQIVNENLLAPYIKELNNIKEEIEHTKKAIDEAGIDAQRRDLKEKIATLTADVDHFQNDLKHQKREYKSLLGKISSKRDELQKEIKKHTGEDVKIKIVIPT
jgi:hypothetical protein